MYFQNPNDGIMLKLSWATVWVGWTRTDHGEGYVRIYLHFHFYPNNNEVDKEIFDSFLPFFYFRNVYPSLSEYRKRNENSDHDGCGCLLGALAFDNENHIVQQYLGSITKDGDELKNALKRFLTEVMFKE